MEPPFPGMDPYLESPEYWSSFHHHLAEELMTMLNASLGPRYFADVEIRAVIDDLAILRSSDAYPDVAVIDSDPQSEDVVQTTPALVAPLQRIALPNEHARSRAVQVRLSESQTLVTAIELLSPANKRGRGLFQYRRKREQLLFSDCHLIEIDLLRQGERPGWEVEDLPPDTGYVCLVNRSRDDAMRISEIWPIGLQERLPLLPVPLLSPDPDLVLDLHLALATIYRRSRYGRRLNYREKPPSPELSSADAEWLDAHLRERGLR
jgi:hypothetical protein